MFDDELEPLVRIAISAGEVIRDLRRTNQGWTQKADGSPVTVADQAAEDLIVAELAKIRPDATIIAEERVADGQVPEITDGSFYLVDALDGTREYVNGRDEYTVNIARIENGVPVLGVVVAPSLDQGFAANNTGARKFSIADGCAFDIQPICARPRPHELVAVVSRSHATPETLTYLEQFHVGSQVSFGSSLKLCKVAEGAADIYPRLGRTMEWDIAAGDAILRGAGGTIAQVDGREFVYGKTDQEHDAPFANPHFVVFGAWTKEDIQKSFVGS
ncbi:MAG: 3'(2'),5'-bisphosphate nucleotidase CysQ [Hyphomicrobiaceae bacterium]